MFVSCSDAGDCEKIKKTEDGVEISRREAVLGCGLPNEREYAFAYCFSSLPDANLGSNSHFMMLNITKSLN